MRKIFNILAISALLLTLGSCNDWLNINVDPNSPTSDTAPVNNRLPWIQYGYNYAYGNASAQASILTYTISSAYGRSNSDHTAWSPGTGNGPTTPYQQWFCSSACNIKDLITRARKEGAYHYIGAAHTIYAMGFMLQTDYYGEMPFTEALGSSLTPKYDDGKTIYEGCLAYLDSALVYFNKEQISTATRLSKGDSWNGGDVNKWIKLVYGLKARWLNKLSKKSIYSPKDILAALEKAPNSNQESTIIHHVNDPGDTFGSSLAGVGDPMKTAFIFDVAAWGNHYRIAKLYMDRLTNPRGKGIEDPRTNYLVPSSEHHRMVKNPAYETDKSQPEYIDEKYFVRTKPVDVINDDLRLDGGPLFPNYSVKDKKWFIDSEKDSRKGDTLYMLMQAKCAMQGITNGDGTYLASDGTIISTGTFYSLPESETDVLAYPEMCFIKAEVLFREGNKQGALDAYKEGVKAHIALMQSKLNQWGSKQINPYKRPMDNKEIDAFLASEAICQKASELTMSDIMAQKHIAMSFTLENWNDMRRFNYSAGNIGNFGVVYPGVERPKEFAAASFQFFPGQSKTDANYWYRRFKHCGHEINYNIQNLKDSNPKALEPEVYSVPVWWDTED